MTYLSYFKAECLALFRTKQRVVNALLFFVMVVVLFPLGIDPSADFLSPAAGGIIWCAVALSVIVSLESMFKENYVDGVLTQLILSGLSLPWLMLIKVGVYWGAMVLPLLILTPIFSEMLFLPSDSLWVLISTLLLGSPGLFLIGSIGAALTVSLKQGAMLMVLLILPFYFPIIIFSSAAIKAVQLGMPYGGLLALIAAISLLALVVSPVMTSLCIKASVR
ncbi:heme exporter protein CcmB [Marinomonas pollencensis]|uniref:Heme exporter protein B n=1 Tax=Marinomonas pollencensis TaxID=491954 RepID=A0A3E0DLI5_9GAMM|nr:heme exporter protein CcmB [Marinomonas pollencensis]REG82961.1 heme exporter protein B [Marinomonas pollencensis]